MSASEARAGEPAQETGIKTELLTHPERQGPPAWVGAAGVVLFLILWELAGQARLINPLLFSWPSEILKAGIKMAGDGTLWKDVRASGSEFFTGFGLAMVVGVVVGILAGWYRWADALLRPWINGLNTMPRLALLPLIILWFGLGFRAQVAVVFLGAFLPIMFNTQAAMRTLDAELLKAARSFEATDWQIFKTIALPASVPSLITGLRLGVGQALICVVVAEMYSADAGLGFLINIAGSQFQTARLFVGLMLITVFGMAANALLLAVERRFDAWRPEHH